MLRPLGEPHGGAAAAAAGSHGDGLRSVCEQTDLRPCVAVGAHMQREVADNTYMVCLPACVRLGGGALPQ